eukprot:gene12748-biopygen91669
MTSIPIGKRGRGRRRRGAASAGAAVEPDLPSQKGRGGRRPRGSAAQSRRRPRGTRATVRKGAAKGTKQSPPQAAKTAGTSAAVLLAALCTVQSHPPPNPIPEQGGAGDSVHASGTDNIKLLNWNADGITTGDAEKMEELIDYAESSKPTIIVITESKLDDGVKDGTVAIPGYSLYRVDRDLGKSVVGLGGGILVFCKSGIEFTDEVQVQGSDMEMFAANIPALQCRLVAVYRRPGYAISEESLAQVTKQVVKNGRTVVTGDLNMDTRVQNPAPQALWLALQEAGLTQRVRVVTHPPSRDGDKASTIDHVWAPRGVAVQCKRVKGDLLDGASDHHAIEATFAGPKQKEKTQSRWTRKWDRVEVDAIQTILASHGIGQETVPPKTEPGLGSLLAKWHAAWNQIKADLAPRKLVIIHKRKRNERLGASARAAVQRRSKARRAFLRSRTPEDKELFKEARQAARNAIRDAKAAMIQEQSEEAGKFAKARWKLRKELAGQARSVPPQPAATAEETNDFFIAKPRRVRQSTLYAPLATVYPTATETMCQFKPVSTGEVLAALRKSRTTWSTGVDDVPMAILKKVAGEIAPFLARLINAIIRKQEWPRCWKTAKVRALWKRKGSRREVKTYRPIALLPAVSRVVEKVIATQLMQQVQLTHALPMWQHGFRPKHGCHTAVMHLVSSITTILERGEDCVV